MSRREKDEGAKGGVMREWPKLLSEIVEETPLDKHCQSRSIQRGQAA